MTLATPQPPKLIDNPWTYKGAEIHSIDDVPAAMGFIYMITQLSTGKRYIGRKLLTSASTKQVKGKVKKTRKASDWLTYWSSSPTITAWIKEAGTSDFKREILSFCKSKGSLAVCEELALYSVGALESDEWLNMNIRARIYRSWVTVDDCNNLRDVLKAANLYK